MNDSLEKLQAENSRLKMAVKELAVINEISSVINSAMTIEEISRIIMKKVVAAMQVEEAAIHTFSEGEGQLSPHTFVRGRLESTSLSKAKLDIRVAGWIARHKKPLIINDIKSDERFKGIDLTDNPIWSLLAVPLSVKGKLIGALTVFNSHRPEGFGPDDNRLLGIIGVQSAQIIENARLFQEELRLRQLQGEVDAARKIQAGFLPREIPRIKGYDIYGGSISAKETGGDYFDFITSKTGQLYFTLGDVSGKGLPAALLMSTIQGQARLLVNSTPQMTPEAILRELNSITCQLSGPAQFATMVVGLLTPGEGDIAISNGGHGFPMIIRANGTLEELGDSSVLIGMFDDADFTSTDCSLEEGDLLAIASDGIEEAFNEEGADFGLERFKEVITDNRQLTAPEIYDRTLEAVKTFRGAAEQSDDITLTVIKRVAQ